MRERNAVECALQARRAGFARVRRGSGERRTVRLLGHEPIVQRVRGERPDREIRQRRRQRHDRRGGNGMVVAGMIVVVAGCATFVLIAIMLHAAFVAALIVHGVRLPFVVAEQERQGRGNALQRHCCERQQQY